MVEEIGTDLDSDTADTARQNIIATFGNLCVALNRREEELLVRVDALATEKAVHVYK